MHQNVREPKQKRAIEKKESLIKSAFDLFTEKGFYNTNSKEIARNAGVSIGLFYNYFNDKSDVFLEILNRISDSKSLKLENFFEALLIETDKKRVLKDFFIENTKLFSELALIYKDIETLKTQYKEIDKSRQDSKIKSKNLLFNFLSEINANKSIDNLDIKCELIITTFDANCILISKLDNEEIYEKYIDEIIKLIYNYMFNL